MSEIGNTVVTKMTLYVDESSRNNPSYVYAKQFDTDSRFLKVTLMDSSGFQPITGLAQLNALKPDGTTEYVSGTVNADGTTTFKLATNLLSVPGTVSCDISVFGEDEDDLLLTTSSFYIVVDRSYYDEDAIESSDEFSTVSTALSQMSGYVASAAASAASAASSAASTAGVVEEAEAYADEASEHADRAATNAQAAQNALAGMNFVRFTMDETGHLLIQHAERLGTTSFRINNGRLEVQI